MDVNMLTLNGGSSSLKFAVYRLCGSQEEARLTGAAEGIGAEQGRFWLRRGGDTVSDDHVSIPDHAAAIRLAVAALRDHEIVNLSAAGHRIVHGGPYFRQPHRIDENVVTSLRALVPFAPLHLPRQIALIEGMTRYNPDLPQVACFDTAFHSRIPEIARRFALPRRLFDEGVMRYGFHGLSYEYVVSTLGAELPARTIIAHLGNGASMVALKDGSPMDTSMGLTPTGGFMMGTRSGDLDPGVILFLLRKGWTEEQLARMLDYESGLLGVSGIASEMKPLLDNRAENPNSSQAVEMFCYQIRKFVGAYATVLGGVDLLVFTGGIGERAADVRTQIVGGLAFLGIELNGVANARNAEIISTPQSRCAVRIVQTDEDLMIARHTRGILHI
jgi:acetate kinase